MAAAKIAISLPNDILREVEAQAERWEESRSGTIARIITEWNAIRRPHLSIVPNEMEDRFPPTEFEEAA